MASLEYSVYPGAGGARDHCSSAVRVGDRLELSGQGGWDPATGEIYREINAQIDQAFEVVQIALLNAGGRGWEQVFRINSYHVPLNNEALAAMVRNMRKWMPDHKPLWTCVGVPRLAEDDMRVELEVVAHDPK